MSTSTHPILTILPHAGCHEVDPANLFIDKVSVKDKKLFFNFKYKYTDNKGKVRKLQPKFLGPILSTRMYEKHNAEYDSVTRKCTITISRERDEDIFDAYVTKVNAIQRRADKCFIKAMEKELKSRSFLKAASSVTDVTADIKKLDNLLFYYEEDKEGNPVEEPDKVQFFSVKIEPNRDWLAPSMSIIHRKEEEDSEQDSEDEIVIPATLIYKDPITHEETVYNNIKEKQLKWKHLLDIRTKSACTINVDSYYVMLEGQKTIKYYRRVFLAHNAIADFIEQGDDNYLADASQQVYRSDDKVNADISSKFAQFSKYLSSDKSDDVVIDVGDSESSESPPKKKKTVKANKSSKSKPKRAVETPPESDDSAETVEIQDLSESAESAESAESSSEEIEIPAPKHRKNGAKTSGKMKKK